MSSIKLEWHQLSYAERFDIFRSLTPMSVNEMPEPIGSTTQLYYFDSSVENDETYYYRVGAVRGSQVALSSEVMQLAGEPVVNDPFWNETTFLVFGDAVSFPSTDFVDRSSFANVVYKGGNPSIVSPTVQLPSTDSGSIYLKGLTDDIFGLSTGVLTNFGTGDLTVEFEFLIPLNLDVKPYFARIIDMNSLRLTTGNETHTMWQLDGSSVTTGIVAGQWHHVCLMRKTGVIYLFINGVLKFNKAYATSLISYVRFGGGGAVARKLNAYFNNVRITKVARYEITGFIPERIRHSTS